MKWNDTANTEKQAQHGDKKKHQGGGNGEGDEESGGESDLNREGEEGARRILRRVSGRRRSIAAAHSHSRTHSHTHTPQPKKKGLPWYPRISSLIPGSPGSHNTLTGELCILHHLRIQSNPSEFTTTISSCSSSSSFRGDFCSPLSSSCYCLFFWRWCVQFLPSAG